MWWRQPRRDDLEDEIAAHLEIEAAQQRSHGLDPDAARAAALRAFGNRTRIAEQTREIWHIAWLDNLAQDLRIGSRCLRKNPGFALSAMLVLALGIGPNTALFSIIHAAFFEALGYPEPDRLVTIDFQIPDGIGITRTDLREIEQETASFSSITTTGGGSSFLLDANGNSAPLSFSSVQPGHFSKTLGIAPLLGRDFLPEEGQPGNDAVAILSHGTWVTQFGADPGIIGRRLQLVVGPASPAGLLAEYDRVLTVVGVMPPVRGLQVALWTPLALKPYELQTRFRGFARFFARLKPGIPLAQAKADVNRFASREGFREQHITAAVEHLRGYQMPEATRTTLWLLAATTSFVLLIACSNLASLMTARGTLRQREFATRASLGASTGRIVTQLSVETLLIAGLGIALGATFGWILLKVLVVQMPAIAALAATAPALSWPILLSAAFVSLCAALLFGTLPMWRASGRDVDHALKGHASASSQPGGTRLRRFLVGFQFAAATALLVSAIISGHRLWLKTQTTSGMHAIDRVLVVDFLWPRNNPQNSAVQMNAFYRDVLSRLRTVPGVESASHASLPLNLGSPWRFRIQGQPGPSEGARAMVQRFDESYFATIGAKVIAGRSFDGHDTLQSEPVAMVNEEFLRRYLPVANPIGTYVDVERITARGTEFVTRRIVGVYADLIRPGVGGMGKLVSDTKPTPEVAEPIEQSSMLAITLLIRTSEGASGVVRELTAVLANINPDRPATFHSLDELAANLSLRERGYAVVFGLLGALALLLSASGIYGLMTFLVVRRTPEIGLRMAIGATRGRVLTMVLQEGLLWALVGISAGFLGAYIAGQTLQSVLGATSGLSYAAFLGAAGMLTTCAAAACWIPALRASRVDPVIALRVD